MKLIVGLGNIGREYENTRHNIGFMVVDELAKRLGVTFGKEDRNAYCAEYRAPEKILIIKPTTYMNLSGIAVGAYANFYHIAPEDIAVIQDDMDLPVGHLRIRRKGSAGGHNGINPSPSTWALRNTRALKSALVILTATTRLLSTMYCTNSRARTRQPLKPLSKPWLRLWSCGLERVTSTPS